jgi:NADPH:quinone reductase
MRAAWYEKTGPAAEVLKLGEMEDPRAGPGEVLVRVRASGINPADTKRRGGWLGQAMDFPRVIPHCDGAGEIVGLGEGVDTARLAERVWLWNAQGGYGEAGRAFGTAAQLIALPARQAVRLPDSLGFPEGACLGVPAMTAYRAVCGAGPVSGLSVLVQGGAGAVGHFAVQFAKLAGARVIATVSSARKAAHARAAGADVVLDYTSEDVAGAVLDVTGGAGVERLVEVDFGTNVETDARVIAVNGDIASYSSTKVPRPQLPYYALQSKGATVRFVQGFHIPAAARAEGEAAIARLAEAGTLQVAIDRLLPIDGIAEAHEIVETGAALGNVVLDIG